MKIILSSRVEDIPIDRECWNSLARKNIVNTVFQTYEWFHSWWRIYGSNHQLVFLTAYEDSRIIGFAPLMLSSQSCGRKILRFAGDSNTDYCDFVISGSRISTIDAFLNFLYSGKINWTSMVLLNIPDHSTTPACLQTISHKHHYNIQLKSPIPAPALIIENHLNEARNSAAKYSVNRYARKLEKKGTLHFYNLRDKQQILKYIDNFFDQHIQRYQLKHQESQFIDSINKDFYIELIDKFDGTDWIIFSVLCLDDTPIAYHLGFDYNNKLIWYKPAFNIDYKTYSPGTIMLKNLIEFCIDSGHSELDFTIGDEAFKSRFCNRTRYNQNIVIYRSSVINNLYAARQHIGHLIQWISKSFRKAK